MDLPSEFKTKFVDEALDNITEIEQILLELELTPDNNNHIESIFRGLHTLKGGGSMFGFNKLSEFTHHIETVYDLVRSGEIVLSQRIISLTFNAVDIFKKLLVTDEDILQTVSEQCNEIVASFREIVDLKKEERKLQQKENSVHDSSEDNLKEATATYYIHFYPGKNILKNGTNLLYLIDDLLELGEGFVIPGFGEVPDFNEINPKQSYIYWDIFLATNKEVSEISDVFIFVESESTLEIHKVSNTNLFTSEQFVKTLNEIASRNNPINLPSVKKLVHKSQSVNKTEFKSKTKANKGNKKYEIDSFNNHNSNNSVRVSTEKIDVLTSLVSELVIVQEQLNLISAANQVPGLQSATDSLQKLTSQLRDGILNMSLIPINSLVVRFQRLVRDLSSKLGKKVKLQIEGGDTEIDKSMIDNLSDPLLHIIRNCIDHGIESPQVRNAKGKPETGHIQLKSFYSGANVIIKIEDDGQGIDLYKVKEKAIERNLIDANSDLSDQEIMNLIFTPGFSTSENITQVSGREVGMDVVRQNINAVKGTVKIDSEKNVGTTITITLPLVLSIIDGLLIRVFDSQYIIPLSVVEHIFFKESLSLDQSIQEIVEFKGTKIPFLNLRKELNVDAPPPEIMQMIVINHHGDFFALAVDKVIGKIQSVLKPLGKLYDENKSLLSD
jgi:two-component system chemotaxis sensor kinase CheA